MQNLHVRFCPIITFYCSTWQGSLLSSFLKYLPDFVLNSASCWFTHDFFHFLFYLLRVPLKTFLLALVSLCILSGLPRLQLKKMKWVPKLPDCPLTLAIRIRSQSFNLTYSKVTNIFHEDLLLFNPSPNTANSIFLHKHSSGHVTPRLKPFLPQAPVSKRRNSNISMNFSKPCDSFLPVWFLTTILSLDLAHPLSPPCPDAPWAPQYHWLLLIWVILSTQNCHFSVGNSCLWCWQSSAPLPSDFSNPPGSSLLLLCLKKLQFHCLVNQWINYLGTVWGHRSGTRIHQHL